MCNVKLIDQISIIYRPEKAKNYCKIGVELYIHDKSRCPEVCIMS